MKVLVCFLPDTSRTVVSRYLYFIGKNNMMLHPKGSFNEKSRNGLITFTNIWFERFESQLIRDFIRAENNTNRECNGTHVSWHYIAQIFRYK